jgi:hypothetical protein
MTRLSLSFAVSCVSIFTVFCLLGCPASTNPELRPDEPAGVGAGAGVTPSTNPEAAPKNTLPALSRDDFNRIAVLLDRPIFWEKDEKNAGVLDPEELATLGVSVNKHALVENGKFTKLFEATYAAMVEHRRREAVARELNTGKPTLVLTDLSAASDQDKAIVRHLSAAARTIEQLYAQQKGSFGLARCMREDDLPSQALFRRNQGPWCQNPGTDRDPFCNACGGFPKQTSGLYSEEMLRDPAMCQNLSSRPDGSTLMSPFVALRGTPDSPKAVSYLDIWGEQMKQVAAELRATAASIVQGEDTFKAYLLAAAEAFESNDWNTADEAWAAMNAKNSRWYLRIAPDEVYFEPCNAKAGFHVSFGRIDQDSLYWQERLSPHQQAMEQTLAALVGPPYRERTVTFHLPDFVEIVLNAGDARNPTGATIGQSLPNWGKVANEGRGRTVVMSNLYTDSDSKAVRRAQAQSLFSTETLQAYSEDKRLSLLDIILHEATHNFGPHSDYKIDGKDPRGIFGGGAATVLEELKAQTGALYFVSFLQQKGLLTQEEANQVYNHAIVWCLGHISRGMTEPDGRPKPYSQLAAIQIGSLIQSGAIVWQADALAANGTDRGRFSIDYAKIPKAVNTLMQQVGKIKATGDTAKAKELIEPFVQNEGQRLIHASEIAERISRYPRVSFVYGVTF